MQRLIELGGERLEQGFSIMVFPEGTRIAVGRRGIYQLGGAVIAVQNGATVVPVAHNAGLVLAAQLLPQVPGQGDRGHRSADRHARA